MRLSNLEHNLQPLCAPSVLPGPEEKPGSRGKEDGASLGEGCPKRMNGTSARPIRGGRTID